MCKITALKSEKMFQLMHLFTFTQSFSDLRFFMHVCARAPDLAILVAKANY